MSLETEESRTPPNRNSLLTQPRDHWRRTQIIANRAHFLFRNTEPSGLPPNLHGHDLNVAKQSWLETGFFGTNVSNRPEARQTAVANLAAAINWWANSLDQREFFTTLTGLLQADNPFRSIDRIVCIGSGTPGRGKTSDAERSARQYAAALWLAETISNLTHGRNVEVFVQEPRLSWVEMDALKQIGITPVNPYLHEGFAKIDQRTMVMAICMPNDLPVLQMILETTRPAAIIYSPDEQIPKTSLPMEFEEDISGNFDQ
ncbi:hypothetical protein GGR56DRAFT_693450 [Xylariaceae sp. FL0804]|nr:hypothetical protein GGR56DRAFT_693450 [Xylariaceae sp. FL0804]